MNRVASHLDPDFISPHLAAEAVYAFASDRCAAAVGEAEAPVMKRADDLAVFDPAVTERAAGMRTAPGKSHGKAAVPVKGQPHARGIQRKPAPFGQIVHPANWQPLGHFPAPKPPQPGFRTT
jgi:hypothetical protein